MPGKERCKQLKFYRNRIAIVNGIDFQAKECDFQGECPGYCPACDEEILLLEKKLKEKEKRGETIKLYGLIKVSFKNGDNIHEYKLENLNKANAGASSIGGNGNNNNNKKRQETQKTENQGPFFLGWIEDTTGDW
jgi:hypothetical protein